MKDKPDFSELLKKGYKFDIGETISDGWKLFAKSPGSYIGFMLLIIVFYFVSVIFIASIGFLISPIVLSILLIIILFALGVLYTGINVYSRNLLDGTENFGDFFKGFESIGQISLHFLTFMLMMLPLYIFYFLVIMPPEFIQLLGESDPWAAFEDPAYFSNEYQWGATELIGYFLFLFASLYLSISYMFAAPLIVDAKMGFWEAMETSRKVVSHKLFSHVGFLILMVILVTVGTLITCGLGALAMYPFLGCTIFIAYNSIFSPYLNHVTDQIDSFGSTDEFLDPDREN